MARRAATHRRPMLTPREAEVLRYLMRGLTVRQVARQLKLSPKTVDTHKTLMMRKLRVHNRVELIWYAIRAGMVQIVVRGRRIRRPAGSR